MSEPTIIYPETLFYDGRKIKSVSKESFTVKVGLDGITAISVYNEYGQNANVPWFAIWKGGFLYARMDAAGTYVTYFEE